MVEDGRRPTNGFSPSPSRLGSSDTASYSDGGELCSPRPPTSPPGESPPSPPEPKARSALILLLEVEIFLLCSAENPSLPKVCPPPPPEGCHVLLLLPLPLLLLVPAGGAPGRLSSPEVEDAGWREDEAVVDVSRLA